MAATPDLLRVQIDQKKIFATKIGPSIMEEKKDNGKEIETREKIREEK